MAVAPVLYWSQERHQYGSHGSRRRATCRGGRGAGGRPDEFGVQWSARKRYGPDHPRYALHWFWSLGQVGLGDVKAEIVRRDTKRRVWPPWNEATDHLTERYERVQV
jgi:hypothetical protein